ncbi:MAG: LysR family transcriptional regulator [Polyangiaceae bacterium]
MFNFHHLHYFWAVAHEENLTRAAEHLHVSQSAISMQIRKLEAELGHPLFERRGKRLLLTEAGRIALDHADAIFARGKELESALGERGRERHVLRVGSLATLSRNFQLGFLKPLFGRDDVEIVVRSGSFADMLRVLEAHLIDVVLANFAPPTDAGTPWVAHPIAKQPVSLVGHRVRKKRPKSLAALLASEPLVLPAAESSVRAGFDALVNRLGVRPRIVAEVDDMAMLRLLVSRHLNRRVAG